MTVPVTERDGVRSEMRGRRRTLSAQDMSTAAAAIALNLERLAAFRRARSVAGYWPVDGEADVRDALLTARSRGAQTLLPVVGRSGTGLMRFASWSPGVPLTMNRYGIPEPLSLARRYRAALSLDVVLVPLVAFDDRGHRIGMGGGYYDRCFARVKTRPLPWPQLVGVGYEYQRVSSIERTPWDVTLSWVVTEDALHRCR